MPTKYCSFWFTQDALYIDTAGTYTKPDLTKPRNDLIWQGFIKLLQKYFGSHSISNLLIILDLPALISNRSLLLKTLFCIRERIYETSNLVRQLNLHLIFTKCDRISGFTEFFSTLDREERKSPFGISFTPENKTDLVASFDEQFCTLLQQLNHRVIENLQKSIHPLQRYLIKNFPSQMENLRSLFIEIISKIPSGHHIHLAGCYFTSSIQNGLPCDPIKPLFISAFSLQEKSNYELTADDEQSYFIEELFKKTINLKPKPISTFVERLKTAFPYLLAFLLVSAATESV